MAVLYWHLWWVWVAAGIAMMIVEVAIPGFIFLGFGIGAVLVGVLVLTGLALSLPLMLVEFAALSLVTWLILRRVFARPGSNARIVRRDIND
ncbi:hypothetical protein ATO6_12120 [Oceanicola sp. 22II-s10i]|uniref:NfeD family protein n=1 Tax=Oceanicola sp. 22II-s10i TaxID=1317116 RepID=UPI000B528DF3|nr:hypothetical protein [Oceanicola sp. 22II-s10i]OWU84445.1 hypothetical protein ATO6_12120 [Oceanicola sp. 22II-s10i]